MSDCNKSVILHVTKLYTEYIGALLGNLEGVILLGLLREKKQYFWASFLDPEVIKILSLRTTAPMIGVGEETSAHILCECKALAPLRHAYLGSFFLEPEDIRNLGLGAIWSYSKAVGAPTFRYGAQRVGHKRPRCIEAGRPQTQMLIYLSIYTLSIRICV